MGLFQKILNRFKGGGDVDWDDLEETLVTSDLGIRLTTELVERVQAKKGKKDAESVVESMREEIREILGATPPQVAFETQPCAGSVGVSLDRSYSIMW